MCIQTDDGVAGIILQGHITAAGQGISGVLQQYHFLKPMVFCGKGFHHCPRAVFGHTVDKKNLNFLMRIVLRAQIFQERGKSILRIIRHNNKRYSHSFSLSSADCLPYVPGMLSVRNIVQITAQNEIILVAEVNQIIKSVTACHPEIPERVEQAQASPTLRHCLS